jgi:hypothetical protein
MKSLGMLRNLLILLSLASGFVHAETRYWVCLASFEAESDAQAFRTGVAYEFVDALTVTAAETPMGRYYRVLLGPFDGPGSRRALDDARRTRPDAWIVAADAAPSDRDDDYDLDLGTSDYEYSDDYTADYPELEPLDAAGDEPAPIHRTPSAPATEATEPVSTAPPSYGTHRLKRATEGSPDTDD